ncbi:hypothetical protein PDENDC454_18383 [Paenibacillus dendritiformis C454]|uniref:Uncharacterized protein n=1 Tax=Paenibacillus dendritiformis C454 TaxID=1131935 RepID=H3SJE9_9BACL|nr:hypothetical protein PDENDC454_18383 [Paenibacillus dendritiformis C454]
MFRGRILPQPSLHINFAAAGIVLDITKRQNEYNGFNSEGIVICNRFQHWSATLVSSMEERMEGFR